MYFKSENSMQFCDENKLFVASLAKPLGFPIQNLIRSFSGEAEGIKNRYKMTNKRKNTPPTIYNREFGQ